LQEGKWQGRDAVRHEMGRLREGLQGVVRAVNPLARLLDFLQEDIESMQLELDQWRLARDSTRTNLLAEKRCSKCIIFKASNFQIELKLFSFLNVNSRQKSFIKHTMKYFRFTEETLAPLRAQLTELDKKLEQQEQLNTVLRTNILMNDQKMWQRISH